MKLRILFLLEMSAAEQEEMIQRHKQCDFFFKSKADLTAAEVANAEVIIGNPPVSLLNVNLTNLKWIQLASAGFNEYLETNVLPDEALLTNARGAFGLTVAEHAISLLLVLMRKLDLYLANQRQHLWRKEGRIQSIYGAKIGIVGLGNIGITLAEKLQALGAEVIGISNHYHQSSSPLFSKIYSHSALKMAFSKLDVLVLCLPATEENYHFINQETLSYLKTDAFLINVSRGSLVDVEALKCALNNHLLAGAALDVFEQEPLPVDDPLWDTEHLIITPHAAGGFTLPATKAFVLEIINKNIELFTKNNELVNLIDKQN